MEFNSMGSLALHLLAAEALVLKEMRDGLEACAVKIEATAKTEIGHYQPAAGPFAAWADLADSTEAEKARKGYPADAPLEASGAMRESITHKTETLETVIGSTDPKMVFHEFGTMKMPARAVMGPAVFRNKEYIRRVLGQAAVRGLVGGAPIHGSLGYDQE